MTVELIVPLLAAAIQSGTPILYATLGEILTEKSGVLNLGVEGINNTGALAARVSEYAVVRDFFASTTVVLMVDLAFLVLFVAVIAYVGPSVPLLVVSVIIDGFTTSWSTVAFVGLISILANRAFTASQYALMASIATMGRTVLGSSSGALVDWLNGNWALFFVLTTLMVIPGLLFLYSIRKPIQRIEDENKAKTAAYEASQANE